MFLIEYSNNKFVNGERIDWLEIDEAGIVYFTVEGDHDSAFFVDSNLASLFLNNLQSIDGNRLPIEWKRHEIIS